jgi:hypothetical protein
MLARQPYRPEGDGEKEVHSAGGGFSDRRGRSLHVACHPGIQ